MNWYSTNGTGSQVAAGLRADDSDAMCGNAVMYDATAGKILVVGGSINYVYLPRSREYTEILLICLQQNANATSNAHIITIGTAMSAATVQKIGSMSHPRIFANAVVLPTGAIFISGGQNYGIPFSDNGSQLQPEMWDPVSATFTTLAPQAIPRNYHSIGILLPDATVLSAGGGLCGACATNHFDGQIYSPSYLFNPNGTRAIRPVIESAPSRVSVGGTLTAIATAKSPVTDWAMLRVGATTRKAFLVHTLTSYLTYLSIYPSVHLISKAESYNRHREHGPATYSSQRHGKRHHVHHDVANRSRGARTRLLLSVRDECGGP